MSHIAKQLIDLIGNTPLLELSRYARYKGLKAELTAKLEYFNPGGSVKDRVALAMIDQAASEGKLNPGGTIVEPTSGNTGIGLAVVSAVKGYRLILTMPETMSLERRVTLKALGAEIVLTPGNGGMKAAIDKAEEIRTGIPGAITLDQFSNAANPAVHAESTAREIWNDTSGRMDFFVGGVGTGGTVCGVGKGLKSFDPSIQIVAVEPQDSPVLSGGNPGPHQIQGIGAGFVPKNYQATYVDRIMQVSYNEAVKTSRELARTEGLLVGISSGAAAFAATQLALQSENRRKRIVVLLPDGGERYLSTPLFDNDQLPL
ncbi:MAG: cysteine synthase A [Bacteroidales bacterium]|jgi:cysteine synthase A